MRRKDAAGRVIDPFKLFDDVVLKSCAAVADFAERTPDFVKTKVLQGDARALPLGGDVQVDAVITSPPYQNAVDYYRRHTLEMYWLGFTKSIHERHELRPRYIGRSAVPKAQAFAEDDLPGKQSGVWERRIRRESTPQRADAFRHYMVSIAKALGEMAKVLKPCGHAVVVVGNSRWNETQIPTCSLVAEAAEAHFDLADYLWYPLKNRYMSYARHNRASIDKEYVLILTRRPDNPVRRAA